VMSKTFSSVCRPENKELDGGNHEPRNYVYCMPQTLSRLLGSNVLTLDNVDPLLFLELQKPPNLL